MSVPIRIVDLSPRAAFEAGRSAPCIKALLGWSGRHLVAVRTFTPEGRLTKAAVAYLAGIRAIEKAP